MRSYWRDVPLTGMLSPHAISSHWWGGSQSTPVSPWKIIGNTSRAYCLPSRSTATRSLRTIRDIRRAATARRSSSRVPCGSVWHTSMGTLWQIPILCRFAAGEYGLIPRRWCRGALSRPTLHSGSDTRSLRQYRSLTDGLPQTYDIHHATCPWQWNHRSTLPGAPDCKVGFKSIDRPVGGENNMTEGLLGRSARGRTLDC